MCRTALMTFFHSTTEFTLQGKSLIVPVVSTANVGQLAIDLIIASLRLDRIGIFDPQYFIPVVGGREGNLQGISTPFELYGKTGFDFVVVQQRSPALKAKKEEFIKALLNFVSTSHFGAVLFLSGVDLSNRTDAQMLTPTYQIHPLNTPNIAGTPLHNLANLPIPIYTSPVHQNPMIQPEATTTTTSEQSRGVPFVPGGGLTRRILSTISTSQNWTTPTGSLLQFVLEGDNRADAVLLASVVSKVLGIDRLNSNEAWKEPDSWSYGLFGAPHDQALYG